MNSPLIKDCANAHKRPTRTAIEPTPDMLARAGSLELVTPEVPAWAKPSVRAAQSALIEKSNQVKPRH